MRRPPVTLSTFSANARLRKLGAEVITPNEASAMPPDLMKYRLFMIYSSLSYFDRCTLVFVHYSKRLGSFTRDQSTDRKSTRLNSSHSQISYAVFCLKKKKKH